MSGNTKLRIGIIGAGANTRERHIPGFQELPDVEVVVVANRSTESSRRVAETFGIPAIASDWREVIEHPGVDAVCIGTWPYLHAEASIAALEAGRHVLTEARMAMDLAEAQRMTAAAAAHPGIVAQVVPAPFSLDFDSTVRRLVENGELGELRFVEVAHLTGIYADADLPFTWRQDVGRSGKNMLTLGICHEMLLRWLLEGERVTEVGARGHVATPRRRDPESGRLREVQLPEWIAVSGHLAGGGAVLEHFSGLHVGAPRFEVVLGGARATLRVDLAAGRLWLAEQGRDPQEVNVPAGERRGWKVEADFVDAIRSGSPVSLTSFSDGLRYMAFTDAVHTAWKSGRTEPVSDTTQS